MPKKFAVENSKAVAARERKKIASDLENTKKQQKVEDEYWKDDDKQVKKKLQRKEDVEKKREQMLAKKAETKALLEKELETLKPGKPKSTPTVAPKITRAQIDSNLKKVVNEVKKESVSKEEKVNPQTPLEENINRLTLDCEEARNVSDAIEILSSKTDPVDKHPEKRLKAAYTTFEEKLIAELKIEHPSLRLSQLKQMAFKEWQKSPENPLNKV